ncbi:MAG: hypothetical protein LZF60_260010 [Nitrospira sp.]|nr:MAG: hypothetical protein LZF60_260010 [Nitrospira sp.]
MLICPLGKPDHPRRDADGCEEKAGHEEEFKRHEGSLAVSPLLTRESQSFDGLNFLHHASVSDNGPDHEGLAYTRDAHCL